MLTEQGWTYLGLAVPASLKAQLDLHAGLDDTTNGRREAGAGSPAAAPPTRLSGSRLLRGHGRGGPRHLRAHPETRRSTAQRLVRNTFPQTWRPRDAPHQ